MAPNDILLFPKISVALLTRDFSSQRMDINRHSSLVNVQCAETERPQSTHPYMGCPVITDPQGSWVCMKEEAARRQEPEVMDDFKETTFSTKDKAEAHGNSQRL